MCAARSAHAGRPLPHRFTMTVRTQDKESGVWSEKTSHCTWCGKDKV